MLPAPLGAPLSVLYGGALVCRNALMPEPVRAGVPVICIGNITVGGTGKTPMAGWVVEVLKKAGKHPAILTRGYGGDEPRLLEKLGVPVIAEPDRVRGAALARGKGADVLVMDDGFQHLRLARDLDIVLVDATDPWGGGHLLPWGRLREPREALGRAQAVVITRIDQAPETVSRIREEVARLAPSALLAEAVHDPVGGEDLSGKKVLAVCGIGNPEAFRRTLESLGAQVTLKVFPDHHRYTTADVAAVNTLDAGTVVMTEKDAAKLGVFPDTVGWKALKIRMRVSQRAEALEAAVCGAAR
jgi:tetraacyldisaccharide 4'-kinase